MPKPSVSISNIKFSDGSELILNPDDKVIVVGPNNSGKSLTLREIETTISTHRPIYADNYVVKGLNLSKIGTTEELKSFLEEHADLVDSTYRYQNVSLNSSNLRFWIDQPNLYGISSMFIKRIAAETRLSTTHIQSGIGPGQQKETPQQVLFDDEALMERISGLFKTAFGQELFFDFRGGPQIPIHTGIRPQVTREADRVSDAYVKNVRACPSLHKQGDGMKCYAGLLFEVVATERDITLIDEPEAFLHPPQMRRLGETMANETNGQLIVATHSSDILRGFLSGTDGEVSVIRLQRDGDVNKMTKPPVEAVKQLWEQPDLRYSNALEGLFHEQAVICEDDSDCRLFNSVADHLEKTEGGQWKDTVYIPSGGKHAIPRLATVLVQIGVPVKAVFDIDFLREEALVKSTVEVMQGDWGVIESLWSQVNAAVINGTQTLTNSQIKAKIIKRLKETGDDELPKSEVTELLKNGKPWNIVKKLGKAAIPNGDATTKFTELVTKLNELGIEPPLVYRSQKSTETRRMTNGNSGNRFTPEIRARAVCLVLENEADYTSRTQAVLSIAKKIGCNGDTLRVWVRNHEIEIGLRNGVTQAERDELKILQRENKELRQANDILRKASAFFAAAELDRLRKK